MTSIGDNTFYNCISLCSVTIPNSLTSIGKNVFYGCSCLTSVYISDIAAWCKISFSNYNSNPLYYAHHLYLEKEEIKDLIIPSNVSSIGGYAFNYLSNLSSVTIPNSLTSIGHSAFHLCSNLTSVTIPNSVTNIGEDAFSSCYKLTSITIGKSVKNIDSHAFGYCYRIKDLYCIANKVPLAYSNAFENSYDATLHVPASALNDYKTTAPWSSFKSIVSLSETSSYTLTYMVDGEVYKTYTLAVGTTITPEPEPQKEGYTFSGWSTIPKTMPEHDVTVYGTFTKNTTYSPGDVNNDGSVSVTDVGCAINYILEQVPSPFVFEAADMNGDNSVSVTDVGMIINIILSDGASRLERNGLERNENNGNNFKPSLSLMPVNEGYELQLENKDAYIGFQFDVELAEGATISDMRLASADDNDHVLTYRQLDNGKWRVVCYSPSNSTFVADDTPMLTITIVGNASERYFTGNAGIATLGSVAHFSNIRLTTAEFDELRPTSIEGLPTGIASIEQGMMMSVENRTLRITSDRNTTLRLYSLDDCIPKTLQVKKGVNSFDGLRAGIYMINNQKVILR